MTGKTKTLAELTLAELAKDAGTSSGVYFDRGTNRVRGLMLRITPAGARAWCLNYRVKDTGRERRLTIGDVAAWPIAEARKRAAELRREVDSGGDPLGQREEKRAAPTVADLVERFIEEALPSRAPRTQAEYRAMWRDWILPALGRLKVVAVDREDVEKLHRKITAHGKARRANSVKSLCSALFSQAIVWGLREDNPVHHIKGNPEHGRERYLLPPEIERLVTVLERWRAKRPDSVDAITLAMLTGARRGEILGMRYGEVDLGAGVWSKPAASTKQRTPHRTPLSEAAVAVLRRRQAERDGKIVRLRDDHVFRGAGSKTHCNTLERDWYQIRCAAGLEDVRFHDLRHSFASQLVSAGLSFEIIGRLLGHTKPETTKRYSHLADQPLREAAEIVAGKFERK
jgi:integrase